MYNLSKFFIDRVKNRALRDFYFKHLRGNYMRAALKIEPFFWRREKVNILTADEATELIGQAIETATPYAAARMGASEIRWLHRLLNNKIGSYNADELLLNVGLFPNDPALHQKFLELYGECLSHLDLLAVWYGKRETRLYRSFQCKAQICDMSPVLLNVEELALGIDRSWLKSLQSKKVAVISSFPELVAERANESSWKQYWGSRVEWPGATFVSLRFPYGQEPETAAHYGDSLKMLAQLKEEWLPVIREADVVLAGCGGYAIPLLTWAKQEGKVGIHLASHVQLLFGIKGGRWDNREGALAHLYNEHWVRPPAKDRPKLAQSIEQGCYW